MIDPKIFSALKKFYNIVQGKNILWILSGSTSLAIQGVDVSIGDIDILTNQQGSKVFDELLDEYRIKAPEYLPSEKYQSYLGVYEIDDVKVEVQGEFQYKMKDGSWSIPSQKRKIFHRDFEGMNLPMLSLEQELQEYENNNRLDKVEKIKEALKNKI